MWPVKYTVEKLIHYKKDAPEPNLSQETFRNGKCPEINCLRLVRFIVIKQSQWVETIVSEYFELPSIPYFKAATTMQYFVLGSFCTR